MADAQQTGDMFFEMCTKIYVRCQRWQSHLDHSFSMVLSKLILNGAVCSIVYNEVQAGGRWQILNGLSFTAWVAKSYCIKLEWLTIWSFFRINHID